MSSYGEKEAGEGAQGFDGGGECWVAASGYDFGSGGAEVEEFAGEEAQGEAGEEGGAEKVAKAEEMVDAEEEEVEGFAGEEVQGFGAGECWVAASA